MNLRPLIGDVNRILAGCGDEDFTCGLLVFQTAKGNFLTIHRGENSEELEAACEAACVALGKEPEE